MRNMLEDDSDTWLDDGSIASTDDLSSNTGDIDSVSDSEDFEFLSQSSSHIPTEDDEDDDVESTDSEIIAPHTPSLTTDSILSHEDVTDNESVDTEDNDRLAETLLESHELPTVLSRSRDLDDSTATIAQAQRERQDTITQPPKSAESETSTSKPFHILYAGSTQLKSTILRKIGQALMTTTLKEKSDTTNNVSPTSAAEWNSGITSIVPISNFDSSDKVPEVEFVEDSLVKMRITNLEGLECWKPRNSIHFQCTLNDNAQIVSCHHFRRHHTCLWFDKFDTYPSLLVYASPFRGETTSINLQKTMQFAQCHHIPLLFIGDTGKVLTNFTYHCNDLNDLVETGVRNAMLGIGTISPMKFIAADSAKLGEALINNAIKSRKAVESSMKVPNRLNLEKRMRFRIALAAFAVLLLLFFNVPLFKSSVPPINNTKPATSSGSLATTPVVKDLNTQSTYTATVTLTSLPSTVTVIEEKVVTVPIFHTKTKTVTTSTTPLSQRNAKTASTRRLEPITASVNVPAVSLIPKQKNVEYNYQLAYSDDIIQFYLDTENSVLVRAPKKLPGIGGKMPKVVISVRRDGVVIPVDIREFRENMAFITWQMEECHDQLEVHVYTKPGSVLEERIIIDYNHPLIDPKLWELLGQTQKEMWRRLSIFSNKVDRKVKEMAAEVKDRAKDPATYERFEEMSKKARKVQEDLITNVGRQMNYLYDKYRSLEVPKMSEREMKRIQKLTEQVQRQVDGYIKVAQDEALRISDQMVRAFFPAAKQQDSPWIKGWCEAVEKKTAGKKADFCGKNGKSIWRGCKPCKAKHRR